MSDQKYIFPGAPDWAFSFTYNAPRLQHKGGAYFVVTTHTTPEQIAEAVRGILRGTTMSEFEIEATAQASMLYDWQAMLAGPYPVPSAPLLNAVPTLHEQKADNTAQVEEICALVRRLAA